MANDENQKVTLKAVITGKNGQKVDGKTREFTVKQANQLLSMSKKAWKLADDKWKFNGTELAKK